MSQSSSNYLSDTNTPPLETGVDAMPFLKRFCKNNTAPLVIFLFIFTHCLHGNMVCSSVTFEKYGDTFWLGIIQVFLRKPQRKRSIFPCRCEVVVEPVSLAEVQEKSRIFFLFPDTFKLRRPVGVARCCTWCLKLIPNFSWFLVSCSIFLMFIVYYSMFDGFYVRVAIQCC